MGHETRDTNNPKRMEKTMDERDQVQAQPQEEQGRDDSQWTWVNVYDWQVEEHGPNQETGEKWWDVKLASGTFIEVGDQKVDVSKHHFSVNWEPAVTHGEPGTPRCTRGVHLPNDWNLTLKRFENVTPNAMTPSFKEVSRVEKVTPQQLADGIAERNAQWRAAHRRPNQEQSQEKGGQEQIHPGRAMYAKEKRSMEPAL